jgi:large subunit ribosomal protein L17
MRHNKNFNHLGRTNSHRKAMLANMASSLLLHKRIETTTAKAKALRSYVEPLITRTKNLSSVDEKIHAQRIVFSYLKNKFAVKELFSGIAEKIAERPGGYTRILKTGNRLGDNADMCIIELVDYNENMLAGVTDKKSKSKRRRGAGKKKAVAEAVEVVQETSDTSIAESAAIAKQTQEKEINVVEETKVEDKSMEVKGEVPEIKDQKEETPAKKKSAKEKGKTKKEK